MKGKRSPSSASRAQANRSRPAPSWAFPPSTRSSKTARSSTTAGTCSNVRKRTSSPCAATKIAMIFQDPMSSLNPIVKVGKQLTEAMLLKNRSRRRNARKEFYRLLKELCAAAKDGGRAERLCARGAALRPRRKGRNALREPLPPRETKRRRGARAAVRTAFDLRQRERDGHPYPLRAHPALCFPLCRRVFARVLHGGI